MTAYGRNGFRYVVVLGQQFPHVILTVWRIEFVRESSYSIWKKTQRIRKSDFVVHHLQVLSTVPELFDKAFLNMVFVDHKITVTMLLEIVSNDVESMDV